MRRVMIIAVVVMGAVAIYAISLYTKEHKKATGKPAATLTAAELYTNFETNELRANEAYLDAILEVSGVVSTIARNRDGAQVITLESENPMFGISVTMARANDTLLSGDRVLVKGICRGYLSDVVLTDGLVVE